MTGHAARRLWSQEAGCGFCLHVEPGGVWCRGLCRNLPLVDVVKRVGAIRDNVVRLEAATQGLVKPVKPHLVPCAPANRGDRATQQRSTAAERVVSSLQRLHKSAVVKELTASRLNATRKALAATKRAIGKDRSEAGPLRAVESRQPIPEP